MVLRLLRRKKITPADRAVRSLEDAALHVLEIAQRERLSLAYIAGRAGAERAIHWFAMNMLQVVTVDGRRPDSPQEEPLTKEKCTNLELDGDIKALRVPGEAQPQFIDLSVSAAQFAKYLEFVRTTQ